MRKERILVIGGGGWGIALANLLIEEGPVTLWEYFPEAANQLIKERQRPDVLPGIYLHDDICVTNDTHYAVEDISLALFVVPSHVLRNTARLFSKELEPAIPVLSATKGLEQYSHLRMSEVLAQELGEGRLYTVISGPSHAEEVAKHLPTSLVAASLSDQQSKCVQQWFIRSYMRVYTTNDVIGVELGGSLKNVVAIAAGMCSALGYGDNATGTLLTRGLAEITRLGMAMGAEMATFMGLTGLGDLITTCISPHSRNRYFGERIGRGESMEEIFGSMTKVAEGVRSVESVVELGKQYSVRMPIAEAVKEVIFSGLSARVAAESLMTRDPKPELYT